ncbi:sugar phosphate isomerase/epimerase family protein [Spirochaetota bacterium]
MDHLEIDLSKDHSFIKTFNAERCKNLLKLAKLYDVSLSLHTPYTVNPAELMKFLRKSSVSYLLKCVKVANLINATHITTHIGYYKGMPFWQGMRGKALKRLVHTLRIVLESCEKYNVKLALENAVHLQDGAEIFYLGDSIRDFEYIFEEIDSPYLKLCLDTGHANTNNEVMEFIKTFGDKIINIHYHDNNGLNDEHLCIGEGTVPWDQFARALQEIDFHGPFISECFKVQPHRATEFLARIFKRID